MKLVGIIEKSLGGFSTIRGYADLGDLVAVSKAEDFQRKLIPTHVSELEEFYRKGNALFFPEIVLAYTLKYDYIRGITGTMPLQDIHDKKIFRSNIDPIVIKPIKVEPRKQKIVEIRIDNRWIRTNKPFSIIDGNHRVSAFINENTGSPYESYITPFCLILFEDNDSSRKNQKIIFHNINSKAKKLTTEEELKGIISNDFTDDELKNNFGKEYFFLKKLSAAYPSDQLESILCNLFSAFKINGAEVVKNAVLFNLITFLFKNSLIEDRTSALNIIKDALREINNEFHNFQSLKTASNSAFLIAAVGVQLNPKINLKPFCNWLSQNHLSALNEIRAQSLYDIYIKLNEQRPKVFVAMPYFSGDEIESYNSTYQRIVARINSENPDVNLELYPIMIHKGGTKDIVMDMLNQINGCTIFIADISKANANVAYELGYARSRDIKTIIIRRTNDTIEVPFDYDHDVRNRYNPLAHNTLEDSVYRDIKAILIEKGYIFP